MTEGRTKRKESACRRKAGACKTDMYDIVIAGAGTAGLTTALYALRSGKKAVILECEAVGGQITLSPCVENYPGISNVSGMDFADGLLGQVQALGGEVTFGKIIRAEKTEKGFAVITEDEERYEGRSLVIATGAKHRMLGIEGEKEMTGRGISYCAVCDGAFYRNQEVAVVGGGSSALQDALYLAKTSSRVYLIHRRDTFRAEEYLVNQVKAEPKIVCIMNSTVEGVKGSPKLESVVLKNKMTGEKQLLPVSGLFAAVGMVPDNQAFAGLVELDETGYVIAGEDCRTSMPGVFAAGDCRTKEVRQLTTAAADGSVCGLEAGKRQESIGK